MIAIFSLQTNAAPAINHHKANCFIKYLKAKGKLNSDFQEYPDTDGDDCVQVVKEGSEEFYKSVALKIRRGSIFNEQTACIMADFRSQNLVDDFILLIVYEYDKNTSDDVKEQKADEYFEKTSKVTDEIVTSCLFEKVFGALYDQFGKVIGEDTDAGLIEDYCGRKYVVENNLFAPAKYEVELNPKNVNVVGVDCDEVNAKNFRELGETIVAVFNNDELAISELQKKCAMKKYHDGGFNDRIIASAVSAELNLTAEQRAFERKEFTKTMVNLLLSMEVCDH